MRVPAETFIHDVYDCVADSARWPDLLQRFAEQIDAVGCIVFEWRGDPLDRQMGIQAASSFYEVDQLQVYIERMFEEEAADQDKFEAQSIRTDKIDLVQDDVLAPSLDELKKRKNVITLRKLGILHRAAGLLNKDNTAHSRFSIQLGADRGRMTVEEQAYSGQVLPHIAKAFDLGRSSQVLNAKSQGLLAAMNRLKTGLCVLDGKGRMVVENEEFARQREHYRLFRLTRSGELEMFKPADQKVFEHLKDNARNHGQFGARPRKEAIAADRDIFLCVEVTPIHQLEEHGSKGIGGHIVHSFDTSQQITLHAAALEAAYDLTRSEAEIVDLISEGLTNTEIAERRSRALATINAQVKSVLSKTGCSTRTQLVRLMISFGVDMLKS